MCQGKKAIRRVSKLRSKDQRTVIVINTVHPAVETLFPVKLAKANALLKELGEIKF